MASTLCFLASRRIDFWAYARVTANNEPRFKKRHSKTRFNRKQPSMVHGRRWNWHECRIWFLGMCGGWHTITHADYFLAAATRKTYYFLGRIVHGYLTGERQSFTIRWGAVMFLIAVARPILTHVLLRRQVQRMPLLLWTLHHAYISATVNSTPCIHSISSRIDILTCNSKQN